jgi:hypothetical protein
MPDGIKSSKTLHKNLLSDFTKELLLSRGAADIHFSLRALLTALCDFLNLDLHPDCFVDDAFSLTPYGKALSPVSAAQCAEDIERSRVFMLAVHQAITDRLNKGQPVRVLYAGTGPLGWLILPTLQSFNSEQLQVTALDIHQQSLDSFQALCNELGLQDRVCRWLCSDATAWQPEQTQKYELILSETMNQFLEKEPQVQIFAHLQQFLLPDGLLIPQQVQLTVDLQQQTLDGPKLVPLGELFCLNIDTARMLAKGAEELFHKRLQLPVFEPAVISLKLNTRIQVYRDFWLEDRQSQLSLPKFMQRLWLKPGTMLRWSYLLGQNPRWHLDYEAGEFELAASEDCRAAGLFHLYRLWQKTLLQKFASGLKADHNEWLLDKALLDLMGLGLQPGLALLFSCNTLSELCQKVRSLLLSDVYIQQINHQLYQHHTSKELKPTPIILGPLSDDQLAFWHQHGYLVIPDVLTPQQCKDSRQAIWQFLEACPEQPESWYQSPECQEKIMLPLYRHPALDANRQLPLLRQIFEQLWQRTDLVMSTDRVSFNPPETEQWHFPGPELHWDMPLHLPVDFATQGLIYLTDTTEQQGAFCCVPGVHLEIENWLQQHADGKGYVQHQLLARPAKAIAGKAGDLVIWHHALPHGASPNRVDKPRMVQYVNCTPMSFK